MCFFIVHINLIDGAGVRIFYQFSLPLRVLRVGEKFEFSGKEVEISGYLSRRFEGVQ